MRALFSITRIALSKATNSYQQNPIKAIAFSSERMAGERQAQPLTNHLVVIDNQTGNRLGHMCSTRRKTSFVYPVSAESRAAVSTRVPLASGFRRVAGVSLPQ